MTDEHPPILDVGSRVTFIDTDGEEHRGLVVSSCPEDDYITVVTGAQAELGEGYNWSVEDHSSVFPHPDEWDGGTTSETHAYRSGWP